MRNHETPLERRRRQLEVIGKKLQSATDQGDEAAVKRHQESLNATEENIRELESSPEPEPTRRRSRREG